MTVKQLESMRKMAEYLSTCRESYYTANQGLDFERIRRTPVDDLTEIEMIQEWGIWQDWTANHPNWKIFQVAGPLAQTSNKGAVKETCRE
jgi:hypothetical protein